MNKRHKQKHTGSQRNCAIPMERSAWCNNRYRQEACMKLEPPSPLQLWDQAQLRRASHTEEVERSRWLEVEVFDGLDKLNFTGRGNTVPTKLPNTQRTRFTARVRLSAGVGVQVMLILRVPLSDFYANRPLPGHPVFHRPAKRSRAYCIAQALKSCSTSTKMKRSRCGECRRHCADQLFLAGTYCLSIDKKRLFYKDSVSKRAHQTRHHRVADVITVLLRIVVLWTNMLTSTEFAQNVSRIFVSPRPDMCSCCSVPTSRTLNLRRKQLAGFIEDFQVPLVRTQNVFTSYRDLIITNGRTSCCLQSLAPWIRLLRGRKFREALLIRYHKHYHVHKPRLSENFFGAYQARLRSRKLYPLGAWSMTVIVPPKQFKHRMLSHKLYDMRRAKGNMVDLNASSQGRKLFRTADGIPSYPVPSSSLAPSTCSSGKNLVWYLFASILPLARFFRFLGKHHVSHFYGLLPESRYTESWVDTSTASRQSATYVPSLWYLYVSCAHYLDPLVYAIKYANQPNPESKSS
ncbi:uncharacterized protein EV420DRAFT_1482776 [Desarmillaria tabescens]|uniref:Uncharacterized protein n=1 Tax=Armillaria tabescens TaxID=1929756 RepID=A0AA39MYC2_ARMTA|nr:uncharacterized protein EV420DRAFT_1482776 [Desarmillaria tabescens]KAK0450574.1 hypothetical protein EV420DRAFT_1482776 [Desarmillaria tabescens]